MIHSIRIITFLIIAFSIRTFEAHAESQDWRTQVESAIQRFSMVQTQILFAQPEAAKNMNATNSFGETVLFRLVRGISENKNEFHVPIEQGWIDLVRVCLEKGGDPNFPSVGNGGGNCIDLCNQRGAFRGNRVATFGKCINLD